MKILSVDIGAVTQDVLLYDSDKNIENCFKMVLPTPSLIYAEKIFKFADSDKKQMLIYGDCIGGGKIKRALKYAGSKKEIFISEEAFKTFTYHKEEAKDFNVNIIADEDVENIKAKKDIEIIKFSESDLSIFEKFFEKFNENFDAVCYAVQEHGAKENMSNRVYRFEIFKEKLNKFKDFRDLAITDYNEIESSFYRFKSLFKSLKSQREKILIMDTAHCAVLGCMEDEYVKNLNDYIVINFGNGHTTFAIIHNERVISYMEHHTKYLKDSKKLNDLIIKFANGKISNEEIYNDGGNGAIIFETIGFENIKKIVVTGPNRNLIKGTNLDYYFASPGGDMMMTGPIGLISAARKKLKF